MVTGEGGGRQGLLVLKCMEWLGGGGWRRSFDQQIPAKGLLSTV